MTADRRSFWVFAFALLLLMAFAIGCNGFFVDPTLQTIVVTPPTPSVPVTQALQLTATGVYDDGSNSNITGKVTWSTSAAGILTVSPSGMMTAVNAGTATVTASQAIVTGSTSVTVTFANVTSITITPSSQTIKTGNFTCFRAVAVVPGLPQPMDISQTATWSVNVRQGSTGVMKSAESVHVVWAKMQRSGSSMSSLG